ncbi:MAG: inositol monophosphatase [Prolixibacteraceae bacterium]|nr:inositol monophosphatase [Prolixibacteraceae bacterium]
MSRLKNTLFEALEVAGEIQLKALNEDNQIRKKESISNIVTPIDEACEKRIVDIIGQTYPGHNVLSEECGFINNASQYTWVVDPLDGTSNFAAGLPWFGVLIALFEKAEPVMGGAYLPVQKKIYFAEKNAGAFLNNCRINVCNAAIEDQLTAFSTDATPDAAYLGKGLEIFRYLVNNSRNVRSTNSLVDFLYTAEGKLGATVNLFSKIWDIAFPSLLIEEAGGKVVDLNGHPIVLNLLPEEIGRDYSIIAGAVNCIDEIVWAGKNQ